MEYHPAYQDTYGSPRQKKQRTERIPEEIMVEVGGEQSKSTQVFYTIKVQL